jgi:RNA polymerase sigma-70 factor, ECF subfamily
LLRPFELSPGRSFFAEYHQIRGTSLPDFAESAVEESSVLGIDFDTDALLAKLRHGDESARQELLGRHRDRLRRMVAVRMDRRLAARLDPSDVVQDVLLEADRGLSGFLRGRPVPFYPWLRQMAWDRLVELHRHHIGAAKRTVKREESVSLALPDESAVALADRLIDRGSSPSERLVRQELRRRVRAAIFELAERDREVLVLRHLEQLTTDQIADVLSLTPAAVKSRHVRALERLERLLRNRDEGAS